MAKGKGKGGASAGPRKPHGPKRKLFHEWSSTIRLHLAKAGLLKKEHNYDSFVLSCSAHGKRNPTKEDFEAFTRLTPEAQKNYFQAK